MSAVGKSSKRKVNVSNRGEVAGPGAKAEKRLFALPRRLNTTMRDCQKRFSSVTSEPPKDIKYLWATFKVDEADGLGVDGWMNVVDEAASLGLDFIVFSMASPLSENPGLWPVCKWAQDTYGITVGIHTNAATLTRDAIEELKKLDLSKARLYVCRDELDKVRPLAAEGIQIGAADPRGEGRANSAPCCDLPNRMLFVSQRGEMYTCRYVENNDEFHMGHVAERAFLSVVKDPELPRVVPSSAPYVSHGCDGCPPILVDDCP